MIDSIILWSHEIERADLKAWKMLRTGANHIIIDSLVEVAYCIVENLSDLFVI